MDVSTLDAGIWVFHAWGYASIPGSSRYLFEVYDRTAGGVETLLFSVTSDELGTSLGQMDTPTTQQTFTLGVTDRLECKVYAVTTNTTDTTVYYYDFGTKHYSYASTPLAVHHNDLSGLQGGSSGQYYHLSAAQYAAATSAAATNGTYPGMNVGSAVFAAGACTATFSDSTSTSTNALQLGGIVAAGYSTTQAVETARANAIATNKVASAAFADSAGTAVFATSAGTATFAVSSGYATNAGSAPAPASVGCTDCRQCQRDRHRNERQRSNYQSWIMVC